MCGKPLRREDEVCAHCDPILSEPPPPHKRPRYTCPVCHTPFAAFELIYLPKDAPWYRPKISRRGCPHCKTPLRSVHETKAFRIVDPLSRFMVFPIILAEDFRLRMAILFCFAALSAYTLVIAYRIQRDPTLVAWDNSSTGRRTTLEEGKLT